MAPIFMLSAHRLWLPSRKVVSMNRTSSLIYPPEGGSNRSSRYSIRLRFPAVFPRHLRVRHSRMLLSLDFPRDGEVLEPSGIQARPERDPRPFDKRLRVVVSKVEPRLKRSEVTALG